MKEPEVSVENKIEAMKWRRFSNSAIWKKIKLVQAQRIQEADKIINMLGGDRDLEFTKRDIAIIKKQEAEAFLTLPDRVVSTLTGTGVIPPEELDAYEEDENLEEDYI